MRFGRRRARGKLRPVNRQREFGDIAAGQRVGLVVLHPEIALDRAGQAAEAERAAKRCRPQRLLGRSTVQQTYTLTCPACRHSFEVPRYEPGGASACPLCRRSLRMSRAVRVAEGE